MQRKRDGRSLVHYQINPDNHIVLGQRATVIVYDHPRLGNNNGVPVYTTEVITVVGNLFETKNNIYSGVYDESDLAKPS